MGDLGNNRRRGPAFQHGSVVRLRLRNFMQYSEAELRPGPSLNLVIGANGSGKSSVVNGLALALGAKTAVLGRADSVADFIQLGQEEAELEVELVNSGSRENHVITRAWGRDPKSKTRWTVNGKPATLKEVMALVKRLNVQTDNLCQFLPQDKVHDFSKMNSKELLAKTVDAVADEDLKTDHERLKTLVHEGASREERFVSKQQLLAENKRKLESLERDVKSFEQKAKIEKSIDVLVKRSAWASCCEAKRLLEDAEKVRDALAKDIKKDEVKMVPLKKAIKEQDELSAKILQTANASRLKVRENVQKCKTKCERAEKLKEDINTVDDALIEAEHREAERKRHLAALESEIESLKAEMQAESSRDSRDKAEELAATMVRMKAELRLLHDEGMKLQNASSEANHEIRALESRRADFRSERDKLMDVDNQKLEILTKVIPQGKDAAEAIRWLENNRDQFEGTVYTPLFFQINVKDPNNNAIYVESLIPARELVAFAAESADDANKMMHQFRDVMKLRVNVFQVDTEENARVPMSPEVPAVFKELDFKGFVSDMIVAPAPLLSYVCRLYGLHNVPVFGQKADLHSQRLVSELRLKSFFIAHTLNRTVTSKYSRQVSTTSSRVSPKNWLHTSLDKQKVKEIERELDRLENDLAELQDQVKQCNTSRRENDRLVEAKKQDIKSLSQQMQYRKVLQGKLSAKEAQRSAFVLESRDLPNLDTERKKASTRKRQMLADIKRRLQEVEVLVQETVAESGAAETIRLRLIPVAQVANEKRQLLDEIDRKLDVLRIKLGEEKENVRFADREYKEKLGSAADSFRCPLDQGGLLPAAVRREFEREGVENVGADECRIRISEMQGHLECLDDVDTKVVTQYKNLKKLVAELEEEIEKRQSEMTQWQEDVSAIRTRWLNKLESMVSEINERFSQYFAAMGYAGSVELHRGGHENDFLNYGIDILVKFRESVPLQKLDPYKQSGGERSVSTALYMMALQHLTKVPFRCVDEINQGMDAVNERKVFDMLIAMSSSDESAQYFLLTPKLLPELQYEENVTVIVVHNGEKMCPFDQWNLDDIIEVAESGASQGARSP